MTGRTAWMVLWAEPNRLASSAHERSASQGVPGGVACPSLSTALVWDEGAKSSSKFFEALESWG